MKHPILSGLAVTAGLLAAGLAANAALEKAAHETLEDVPRCWKCGRAVWSAYVAEDGGTFCHDCGRDLPSDWWEEE